MLHSILAHVFTPTTAIVAILLVLVIGMAIALTHTAGTALSCRCGDEATRFDPLTGRAVCEACGDALIEARLNRKAPRPGGTRRRLPTWRVR